MKQFHSNRVRFIAVSAIALVVGLFWYGSVQADLLGRLRQQFLDRQIEDSAAQTIASGRQIFRHDTFGSEAFWGDKLRLHQAIAGASQGGVGPGVSPKMALEVG